MGNNIILGEIFCMLNHMRHIIYCIVYRIQYSVLYTIRDIQYITYSIVSTNYLHRQCRARIHILIRKNPDKYVQYDV